MNKIELYTLLSTYHSMIDDARVRIGKQLPPEWLKKEEIKPVIGQPYIKESFPVLEPLNNILAHFEVSLTGLAEFILKDEDNA